MSAPKKVFYLLLTLLVLFYTPYISKYISCGGNIPENFFNFPPPNSTPKPPPNLSSQIIFSGIFILVLLLLIFPRLFGFKKAVVEYKFLEKKVLPIWFWIGATLWAAGLIALSTKLDRPHWLVDWSLIPLWWGFILILDGIVYYRNNGYSMIKIAPSEILAMGLLSISGWLIFEYFNLFINLNWYYPASTKLKHDEFLLYAFVGSSAFIPMCFEWYQLLRTFKIFSIKYKNGPIIKSSKWIQVLLVILSIIGLYSAPNHSESLFYMLWLSPLIILSIVLIWLNIWTPFKPIKENGDWTSLLVFSITFFIQGFLVEFWNYISAYHVHGELLRTNNPGYWSYCIPYVLKPKIFEMPLLGYLGYIPFSVYCCIWWYGLSYLFDMRNQFSLREQFK